MQIIMQYLCNDISIIIHRYIFNDVITEIGKVVKPFEDEPGGCINLLNRVYARWIRVRYVLSGWRYPVQSFIIYADLPYMSYLTLRSLSFINGSIYFMEETNEGYFNTVCTYNKQPCWRVARELWDTGALCSVY